MEKYSCNAENRCKRNNTGILAWSVAMAAFCTFTTYPGAWYSDTYDRLRTSTKVWEFLTMALQGQRAAIDYRSWVTTIPSFFIALSWKITGHPAAYTFFQALFFFLVMLLLIREMSSCWRPVQYAIFLFSPVFYSVSIYGEPGAGCATGIAGMILLLERAGAPKSKWQELSDFLLFALSALVAFGYRANTFTILPVLIIYILVGNYSLIKKVALAAALSLGFALVFFLPWLTNIDTMSSVSAGFTWDMLTMIQRMEPEKQQQYLTYMDDIGCSHGATERALALSDEDSVNGFLWQGVDLSIYNLSAGDAPDTILKRYVHMIRTEPLLWLSVKWDYAMKTLGVTQKIHVYEMDYNTWDRMADYQFNDSVQRHRFIEGYTEYTAKWDFYLCRPWLVFLLTGVLVIIEWLRKVSRRKEYVFVYLLAVFYYGAYLINTQSFEIRYFFPALYLLLILDVAIEMELLREGVLRVTERWKPLLAKATKKEK